MAGIANDWLPVLEPEFKKEYYKQLFYFVKKEYETRQIFPPAEDIFNAFHVTPFHKVRVLLLGQDPYHNIGQAHGMSFSVLPGQETPPSLQNIYKELYSDLNIIPSNSGNLTCWAKEGVLLLNSVLTVKKDTPASHKNLGWQNFTDEIIKKLEEKNDVIVYILWGNFARSKKTLITNQNHFIIESAHPSPFSARNGFFGSRPFSKTNKILIDNGSTPINWEVK